MRKKSSTGNLSGACTTSGLAWKIPGRVGDSPIPGAGFFAGPAGAVATTGTGEEIIRRMSAVRVYDALDAGADPVGRGARRTVQRSVSGRCALPVNTV